MRTYHLIRLEDTGEVCRGVLTQGARFVAQTLERPWKENKPQISCIPAGRYECRWHRSPKFGWCYEVEGVPGRDGILFHAGNTVGDTTGCIILGQNVAMMGDMPAVVRSRAAMTAFHRELSPEPFRLHVHDLTLTPLGA